MIPTESLDLFEMPSAYAFFLEDFKSAFKTFSCVSENKILPCVNHVK